MGNLKDYMKVGIVHFMAYPSVIKGEGPICETVKKIAVDDYFDTIEISWIKDEKTRQKVSDMLQSSKIKVCYGAQPRLLTTGMNINDLDVEKRTQAVKTLLEAVDEAKELGAQGIAF